MTEDVRDEVSTEDQVAEAAEQHADAAVAEDKVAAHIDGVLIRRVLEAAILAADGPLDRDTMLSLFDEAERPDRDSLNLILAELAESYADRGIELPRLASGFTAPVRAAEVLPEQLVRPVDQMHLHACTVLPRSPRPGEERNARERRRTSDQQRPAWPGNAPSRLLASEVVARRSAAHERCR